MPTKMLLNKGGDEIIRMVISFLQVELNAQILGIAFSCIHEGFGLELFLDVKFVVCPLQRKIKESKLRKLIRFPPFLTSLSKHTRSSAL